jgi:hypothetical protein
MTTQDIVISVIVALLVNLATPLIQHWLAYLITSIKVKISHGSKKLLLKRKSQLEEELAWHLKMQNTKKLLEWLLPHVFYQIAFLWLLVLSPYIFDIIEPYLGYDGVLTKGVLYGFVGLGTRYFFSFLIIANTAQKSLSFEKTEKLINTNIEQIQLLLQNEKAR